MGEAGAGHIDGKAAVNGSAVEGFPVLIGKGLAALLCQLSEHRQQQPDPLHRVAAGDVVCTAAEEAFW